MVRRAQIHDLSSKREAFTLIELLVVIAIIALLAAIIFPVFFTVRENARATNAMSNMHDISTKMQQYRLDHHAYPPVLFGYAYPGATMDKALDAATAAGKADQYFPGLYPAYVNNIQEFQDPNNSSNLSDTTTVTGPVLCTGSAINLDDANCGNVAASKGQVVDRTAAGISTQFYKADSFDVSPQVTGSNAISKTNFILRYAPSYTGITVDGNSPANLTWAPNCNGGACSAAEKNDLYTRQLRWQFPPGDSYVTCSTWHVTQSNKVLFLTEDGIAKKVDVTKFLAGGPDIPLTVGASGSANAGGVDVGMVTSPIWRLHP